MEKLQVRLMVLLALGTISRGEEVGGSQFDNASVVTSLTPPGDCSPPKIEDVDFNEIKVIGDGSEVVYHRVNVTDWHIRFAMNASVSLPGDSLVECAKAAARAGLEAFVFRENCTGYRLNYGFAKCQWGDIAVFERTDTFAEGTAVVPFDEAPYLLTYDYRDDPYRVYMLSAFVEVSDDLPNFDFEDEFDEKEVSSYRLNVVFLENGDIVEMNRNIIDVNFCLNDGAYGIPVALSHELYDAEWPVLYFFQKCGETIQVPDTDFDTSMLVLSHPGIGCKYYPSDLPDECTVIFEPEKKTPPSFRFYFSEPVSDNAGLIMSVTATNSYSKETKNVHIEPSGGSSLSWGWPRHYDTFTFSLQRQPSKRAIGFFIDFK